MEMMKKKEMIVLFPYYPFTVFLQMFPHKRPQLA